MTEEMTAQRAAALMAVSAVRDAIYEAGGEGIPSGHLYTALMGIMSLETYEGILRILKHAGTITDVGFLLKRKEV